MAGVMAQAHIPERFYGENDRHTDFSSHGRLPRDHVQAWVNSLPTLPRRPGDGATTNLAATSADSLSAVSHLSADINYLHERQDVDKNASSSSRRAVSSGGAARVSLVAGHLAPADGRLALDSHPLQLMKSNYCSQSSDASSAFSSVDVILNERKGNPEELLLSLGFDACRPSLATRLPVRFLKHPSEARGVSAENLVARHPELLALTEPASEVSSAELLHKLPDYYHCRQQSVSASDAVAFSSLHRHFSAKLGAADCLPSAGRHLTNSPFIRAASCASTLAQSHIMPGASGAAVKSSQQVTGTSKVKAVSDVADGHKPKYTCNAVSHEGSKAEPTSGNHPEPQRVSLSISSLSDSVFLSGSDATEDDSDVDIESLLYDNFACRQSSGKMPEEMPSPLDSVDDSNSNAYARLLLTSTASCQSSLAGGRQLVTNGTRATPIAVFVTSTDDGDTCDSEACGSLNHQAGRLGVETDLLTTPAAGSRLGSTGYLSVLDCFESGESDTQTITGDVCDEGGMLSGVFSGDDAAATAVPRLRLASVHAMESFELEEVQSVGDVTKRGAPMERSYSGQSDSSGFAEVDDDRPPPLVSCHLKQQQNCFKPTSDVTALGSVDKPVEYMVPAKSDGPGGEGSVQEPPVATTSLGTMANVVEAILANTVKKRGLLTREFCMVDSCYDAAEGATSLSRQRESVDGSVELQLLAADANGLTSEESQCNARIEGQPIDESLLDAMASGIVPTSCQLPTEGDCVALSYSCCDKSMPGCTRRDASAQTDEQTDVSAAAETVIVGASRLACHDWVLSSCGQPAHANTDVYGSSSGHNTPALRCEEPTAHESVMKSQAELLSSGACELRRSATLQASPAPSLRSSLARKSAIVLDDDAASSVLLALIRPGSCKQTGVRTESLAEADLRLVQNAVQKYRATSYDLDIALDSRVNALPDALRLQLSDEWCSLEDVRRSVAREALTLEANILERLEIVIATRSCSDDEDAAHTPCMRLTVPAAHETINTTLLGGPCGSGRSSSVHRSPGIVSGCTKLLKEQIYQQKLLESQGSLVAMAATSSPKVSACSGGAATCFVPLDIAQLQSQINLLEAKQKYEIVPH